MSAISMASSTIASSPLHAKLSSLILTRSSLPLLTNSLPKFFKPLKLNAQIPRSFSLLSHAHFHPTFAASLDGFETSQDDPQAETQEFEQVEEEQQEGGEEQAEEEVKPTESSGEGRLYVGNLPYSMTSSELSEVFAEAGRVSDAEVIYDRVTDRSRGFGFVTMATVEEAKEAIRLFNGSLVAGRTVKVNFPEVPRGGERDVMGPKIRSGYRAFVDTPYKIYAGNLGWRLTSDGLKDAFADQPGILAAKVIYERDTGRSRGFGFISFNSAEDAEAALNAMNGVEVEGRPLRLNLAVERERPPAEGSSSTEDGVESSELMSGIGA